MLRLVLPRMIGPNHKYWLVGLQHTDNEKNVLCDVAFQAGRSFTGISMLMKHKCLNCGNPQSMDVELCPKCLCVCFCRNCIMNSSNSEIYQDHQRLICGRIDKSKVTIETECIQLLE
jgi:hypothetical protein